MQVRLISPFWISVNVSKGPYSFCLNPHIGLFWTKQSWDKGARGITISVSRSVVAWIDKIRFPNQQSLNIKSSFEDLELREKWYLSSAKEITKIIEKKRTLEAK